MEGTNNSNMSAAQTNSSPSSIDDGNAPFNRPYTLFKEGKYEEAITFYDKILAINPELYFLDNSDIRESMVKHRIGIPRQINRNYVRLH